MSIQTNWFVFSVSGAFFLLLPPAFFILTSAFHLLSFSLQCEKNVLVLSSGATASTMHPFLFRVSCPLLVTSLLGWGLAQNGFLFLSVSTSDDFIMGNEATRISFSFVVVVVVVDVIVSFLGFCLRLNGFFQCCQPAEMILVVVFSLKLFCVWTWTSVCGCHCKMRCDSCWTQQRAQATCRGRLQCEQKL